MFSFYANIKFVLACLRAIRNPQDTDALISAGQKIASPERFEENNRYLGNIPGARELVASRKLLPNFDVAELSKLPPNTLGYLYAQHMIQNNLDPNFYNVDFNDDISYQYYRFAKTHDLWHVLTGFGVSEADEIALLSFTFSQTRGPGVVLIIALSLLHAVLLKPKKLESFYLAVLRGWNLGQQAVPFFTLDWEKLLPLDFEVVRHQVGLGEIQAPLPFQNAMANASIDSTYGIHGAS